MEFGALHATEDETISPRRNRVELLPGAAKRKHQWFDSKCPLQSRFHPCARHQRLITVAAHYGSLSPPGRPRCCAWHASLLHIVRKTSARPDAGGPARTK